MPQLDIASYYSQLFWLTLTFILLYVMLAKFAVPKLTKVLKDRSDNINSDIEKANYATNQAKEIEALCTQSLNEARAKAAKLVAQTIMSIEKEATARVSELDSNIANQLREAEIKTQEAKRAAEDNLGELSAGLTKAIIDKIINIKISDDVAMAAINKIKIK